MLDLLVRVSLHRHEQVLLWRSVEVGANELLHELGSYDLILMNVLTDRDVVRLDRLMHLLCFELLDQGLGLESFLLLLPHLQYQLTKQFLPFALLVIFFLSLVEHK